ncbi:lysozyme inhibitor LprI family protein [Intestinirhabdus alba]|jgi:uncharacterized protein|uniref:DUF1311 domain-containing protein n=1 Tax=Intestinirhabdus alba TaxID=2899544 RepID=A0A6L6IJT6_9ENTR|nr:hypothetical protein [Intestinirhabdus alba]MTH46137.1 hypothetical protein [Intestinirhabdus alba]
MMGRLINCLILLVSLFATSAWAVNCQRASMPLENTICNNDNLHWLDSTMTVIYHAMLTDNPTPQLAKKYHEWEQSLRRCTSDSCIELAYYQGISAISDVAPDFDWEGLWWNTSVANLSGGTIQFSRSAEWSVTTDMRIWSGLNRDEFTAEARKLYGMALVERIVDTSNCKLLFIPRKDGAIQVYSNADWGCRLSMPTGAFIDGRYVRSEHDPRPKPTLHSLGIFADPGMDARFRALVGGDYQKFVDTANVYIYRDDLDNIGATVVSMWVRGAANRHTAIIMYTPSDIWAARVETDVAGKPHLYYFSTRGNDVRKMPRTLASWKLSYLDK